MEAPLDHVLGQLQNVKPRQGGGFRARCPVAANHPNGDRHPSLDVDVGDDGKVLLICRSRHCAYPDIMAAIGKQQADGFAKQNGHARPSQAKSPAWRCATAEEAARRLARNGTLVEHYVYQDANGDSVGLVARVKLPDGGKTMPQARRNGSDWVPGGCAEPVLYRLPELLQAPEDALVLVAEGERKVDLLRQLGFHATCSRGGASNAGKADWSPLAGHPVAVLLDNDPSGEEYGSRVVREAHEQGPPASIGIIRLPGLAEGEDIVDWVEKRRTEGVTDEQIQEQLERLVADLEPIPATAADDPQQDPEPDGQTEQPPPEPALNPIAAAWLPLDPAVLTERPSPRRYLFRHPDRDGKPCPPGEGDGMMPRGKVCSLAGAGGVSKTTNLVQAAVCAITGRLWFGHFHPPPLAERGKVALLLAEEDREEAHRKVHAVCEYLNLDEHERTRVLCDLLILPLAGNHVGMLGMIDGQVVETANLETLRKLLCSETDPRGWMLVILDPKSRFAGIPVEADNELATRLVEACETLTTVPGNPTVQVAAHSSKFARRSGAADDRGVTGWTDGVRWAGTLTAKDSAVMFEQVKSNLSRPMEQPLRLVRGPYGILRVESAIELQAKDQRDLNAAVAAVVEVAREAGEPLSGSELAKLARIKKDDALRACKLAVQRVPGLRQHGRASHPKYSYVASVPGTDVGTAEVGSEGVRGARPLSTPSALRAPGEAARNTTKSVPGTDREPMEPMAHGDIESQWDALLGAEQ